MHKGLVFVLTLWRCFSGCSSGFTQWLLYSFGVVFIQVPFESESTSAAEKQL